jgi:hypothetical protein
MGEDKQQERRDIDVAAVFDIETENWDRYVVGGFLDADGAYLDFDHGVAKIA